MATGACHSTSERTNIENVAVDEKRREREGNETQSFQLVSVDNLAASLLGVN